MTAPIQIGDPVQVDETTEILTVVCIDGEFAWVRDGAGRPMTRRLVDLGRARSMAIRDITPRASLEDIRLRLEDKSKSYYGNGWRP